MVLVTDQNPFWVSKPQNRDLVQLVFQGSGSGYQMGPEGPVLMLQDQLTEVRRVPGVNEASEPQHGPVFDPNR